MGLYEAQTSQNPNQSLIGSYPVHCTGTVSTVPVQRQKRIKKVSHSRECHYGTVKFVKFSVEKENKLELHFNFFRIPYYFATNMMNNRNNATCNYKQLTLNKNSLIMRCFLHFLLSSIIITNINSLIVS